MTAIGYRFAHESMGTLDGPGIRYVLFLQGCMMRCKYCHNRDSWPQEGGEAVSVDQILRELEQYRRFLRNGGGLTVSGGEPLLQQHFVRDLFRAAQAAGIHCCLDTNGCYQRLDPTLEELIDATDLVLLDLKQLDERQHRDLTGVSNRRPLAFARWLAERNQPLWIRHVVVPGYTDSLDSIEALADFLAPLGNVEQVELLPYHPLGAHKWTEQGVIYPLADTPVPDVATLQRLAAVLRDRGLKVLC